MDTNKKVFESDEGFGSYCKECMYRNDGNWCDIFDTVVSHKDFCSFGKDEKDEK